MGGHAPRPCAGESAGVRSRLQTGTTRLRDGVPGIGVTSDGADNAPRLRVLYGEGSKESAPPIEAPSRDTHTARAQREFAIDLARIIRS